MFKSVDVYEVEPQLLRKAKQFSLKKKILFIYEKYLLDVSKFVGYLGPGIKSVEH